MGRIIEIFDTTLRDGEQTPGVNLCAEEKLEIAKLLASLKVDVIEAGFPITSKGDFEGVKIIAENVYGPTITALARTNPKDIDCAKEALKNAKKSRIHVFIATSDIHMKYKLRLSPEEVYRQAVEGVKYAKRFFEEVQFSPEDGGSGRTNPEFLMKVLEGVISAGATIVNIPDTVGYQTPEAFGHLIRDIFLKVPNINNAKVSVHCHNDLGMAVANSLSAVNYGAQQVECTINGIGERAGNTALEEVVLALSTRRDFYNCDTNIDKKQIYRTSRVVSKLTGVVIQPNKAVVGDNAFSHESGIHQDGVLKEKTTYEIISPETIGLPSNKIVLGKHSGRHAFKNKLNDMGFFLEDAEYQRLFDKFKELTDKKKLVEDMDIEALVEEELLNKREAYYVIKNIQVSTGSSMIPTATVTMDYKGKTLMDAACGDGPVDAIYNAIDRMTGKPVELVDYTINAVTGGKDALGEARVQIKSDNEIFSGRGISTDILEASAKAYIHAINRMARKGGIINGDDIGRENIC